MINRQANDDHASRQIQDRNPNTDRGAPSMEFRAAQCSAVPFISPTLSGDLHTALRTVTGVLTSMAHGIIASILTMQMAESNHNCIPSSQLESYQCRLARSIDAVTVTAVWSMHMHSVVWCTTQLSALNQMSRGRAGSASTVPYSTVQCTPAGQAQVQAYRAHPRPAAARDSMEIAYANIHYSHDIKATHTLDGRNIVIQFASSAATSFKVEQRDDAIASNGERILNEIWSA